MMRFAVGTETRHIEAQVLIGTPDFR
jgi:hypothetical protein